MPTVPPPVAALAAALCQRALTGRRPAPGRGRAAVVAGITVGSLTMAGSASNLFRRSGTTVQPFRPEEASVLVTTGANRISRNPMYVGMAGLLLAQAVWRRSWVALAPAAAFVVFIDRVQVQAEEAALSKKFGPDYADYRAAVPRWLDQRSVRSAHLGGTA